MHSIEDINDVFFNKLKKNDNNYNSWCWGEGRVMWMYGPWIIMSMKISVVWIQGSHPAEKSTNSQRH
jgi:hypothetical protein